MINCGNCRFVFAIKIIVSITEKLKTAKKAFGKCLCSLYVKVYLFTFLVLVTVVLVFHIYASSLLLHISISAHALSKEVGCWLITGEAWFQFQGHPCGICGEPTHTWKSLSPSSSAFSWMLIFHQRSILICQQVQVRRSLSHPTSACITKIYIYV